MSVITIDGPSAAGKGTLGTKLSKHLNCFYLDSGLLYRQIASWALAAKADLEDENEVLEAVASQISSLRWEDMQADNLRDLEISVAASKIGIFSSVRSLANQFQRHYADSNVGWCIVDGRDAGTVVFPDAMVKLFITAAPDVRAKRRYDQLVERGHNPDLHQLEVEIIQRDLRDQNREIAPLKPAADAYIIDTSEENEEESLQRVLKYLEKYIVT